MSCVWKKDGQRFVDSVVGDRINGFLPLHRANAEGLEQINYMGPAKKARIDGTAIHAFRFPQGDYVVGTRPAVKKKIRMRVEEIESPLNLVEALEFCDEIDALPDALHKAKAVLEEISGEKFAALWFKKRLSQLEARRQMSQQGSSQSGAQAGWHSIDKTFIESLEPPSPDMMKAYLRGREIDWEVAAKGGLPQREVVTVASQLLAGDEPFRAVLLSGAAGEGKSTAVLQLGCWLLDQGYHIFSTKGCEGSVETILSASKAGSETAPLALLIDEADLINNPHEIYNLAKNRGGKVRVVLAARQDDWRQAHRRQAENWDWLKIIPLTSLSGKERHAIVAKITEFNATGEEYSQTALEETLKQNQSKSLLVAMMIATKGQGLDAILADVVRKVAGWTNDGWSLISFLAVVAALEARTSERRQPIYASDFLLAEFLQVNPSEVQCLAARLAGELPAQSRGRVYRLRDPLLSQRLYHVLTEGEGALIDAEALDVALIKAVAMAYFFNGQRFIPELALLQMLPRFWQHKDPNVARRLFAEASKRDPRKVHTLHAWSMFEKGEGNVDEARALWKSVV